MSETVGELVMRSVLTDDCGRDCCGNGRSVADRTVVGEPVVGDG
jgi:hypothetical protein